MFIGIQVFKIMLRADIINAGKYSQQREKLNKKYTTG
jgi:hypothetical protein